MTAQTTHHIPLGYKLTELWVIPADWKVKKLWKIWSFSKGQWIKKDDVQTEWYPCIRYGELYTRHNDYIKKYYSYISKDIALTSRKIKKGDILFAWSWETKSEIWKCASFLWDEEVYAWWDIVVFSPQETNSIFLWYLLNSPSVVKQKASKWQWDAVVHISANSLSDIIIPVPKKEEQQSIATALSDIDNLIKSLDDLIAKKQAIKQWTMQQLLTGKKRLPCFSEKWMETTIWEIVNVTTWNRNTQDRVQEWKYPFFVRSQTVESINTYSYDWEAILTAWDWVWTGKVFHYINWKFDFHQRVYMLHNFWTGVYWYYVYLYFKTYFLERIMSMTAKSSVDSVRKEMIRDMKINLPKYEEQIAIAEVLKDLESNIRHLVQEMNKYKAIKHWMMQQLLTGRIRLIPATV